MLIFFNGLEVNLDNGIFINCIYSFMGDVIGFSDVWDDYLVILVDLFFDVEDELVFCFIYSLQNIFQDGVVFVSENDQVSCIMYFSNYFVYDDGSVESIIEVSFGQQVVVKYEVVVVDIIIGVCFYFFYIVVDISGQEMYINIWFGELDDMVEYWVRY